MFGPYGHQEKAEARLVTALWEYAFFPGQRVNPYAVIGVGVTQYRSWYLDFGPIPGSPGWDIQHRLHVLGGLGVRLFLTPHVFIAPEVRIGLVPLFRPTVAASAPLVAWPPHDGATRADRPSGVCGVGL